MGSRIDNCLLCHRAPLYTRNSYGNAFAAAGHSFTAIAARRLRRRHLRQRHRDRRPFYPGDAADHPAPPADTLAPVVTNFSVPPTSTSLTVTITGITATDDGGVTGFLVTESATKPAAGDAWWSASVPGSYTAATDGVHTLYAYAKDAAGNVSDGRAATVTITLAPGSNHAADRVRVQRSRDLRLADRARPRLRGEDDTAVTGYLITESATKPAGGDAGWRASLR